MNLNQFKLGNIIRTNHGELCAINCISYPSIIAGYLTNGLTFNMNWISDDATTEANGVLLNEDWLLKLGFTKAGDLYESPMFETISGEHRLRLKFEDKVIIYSMNYNTDSELVYVHHLQNYYFEISNGKYLVHQEN